MNRIALIVVLFFLTLGMSGEVPVNMSYQAIIRDVDGTLLVSHDVGIRIQILQGTEFGVAVYVETQAKSTNENGLLGLVIGEGNVWTGTLTGIDWSAGPYFIKTEIDPAGGTNYTITGISQILSVPYALYAEKSGDGFSGAYDDLTGKPDFTNWDKNASDDFSGSYTDLTNKPAFPEINDATASATSVWSSSKTSTELATKANTADVYTKTNLQTSGQAIVHYGNLSNKPVNLDEDRTYDVTLTGDQTIAGSKTFTGILVASAGINANNQRITNVASPTSSTDGVNKAYVDQLLARIAALENNLESGIFQDERDSKYYGWVKIGTQIWMSENLAFLPSVSSPTTESTSSAVYYVYGYSGTSVSTAKAEANYTTYGVLYNWPAAMNGSSSSSANPSGVQGACPSGWHLPSEAEWTQLTAYCGTVDNAGAKLKTTGISLWETPNTGADNAYGFNGTPAGIREATGVFNFIGKYVLYWSATQQSSTNANRVQLRYDNAATNPNDDSKEYGFSVRCIKN
jgi:uncharacterized protein (TIGR02145 family)